MRFFSLFLQIFMFACGKMLVVKCNKFFLKPEIQNFGRIPPGQAQQDPEIQSLYFSTGK